MADDPTPDPPVSQEDAQAWLAREIERALKEAVAHGPITYEDACKPSPIMDAVITRLLREQGITADASRFAVTCEPGPDRSVRVTVTERIDEITLTLNVEP